MVRNYAQLNISVWNDDDFRALTPAAQHLYFLLLSHPTLSYCGVGDWRPQRIAKMATGWDAEQVKLAGAELIDRMFILVDQGTEEFLVRTFVKNDPLMRQRNLGVSMARAYSLVASEGIRGVVVNELQKLESEHGELKGFDSDEVRSVLSKGSIDPSVYPCGNPYVDPSVKGSIDPWVRGQPNPKGDPSIDPSVDPSPTPAPSPTPLQVSEPSKEREDGGKGGPGEKGETDGTESGAQAVTSQPHYESLDALADASRPNENTGAYGTVDDPRCAKHKDLDTAPPCWDCKKAGRLLKARAAEAKQQRLDAINACPLCDQNGMYDTGAGLARCNHQPPLKAVGGPY